MSSVARALQQSKMARMPVGSESISDAEYARFMGGEEKRSRYDVIHDLNQVPETFRIHCAKNKPT